MESFLGGGGIKETLKTMFTKCNNKSAEPVTPRGEIHLYHIVFFLLSMFIVVFATQTLIGG